MTAGEAAEGREPLGGAARIGALLAWRRAPGGGRMGRLAEPVALVGGHRRVYGASRPSQGGLAWLWTPAGVAWRRMPAAGRSPGDNQTLTPVGIQ